MRKLTFDTNIVNCFLTANILHCTEQSPTQVPELLDGISRQRQLTHVRAPAQPKPQQLICLVAGEQGFVALLQQAVSAPRPPAGRQRGTASQRHSAQRVRLTYKFIL